MSCLSIHSPLKGAEKHRKALLAFTKKLHKCQKVNNKAKPIQVRKVCVLLFIKPSGMSIREFLYSNADTMTFCYSPAS